MTDQGTEPRITVADAAAIELGPWTDKPDDLGPDIAGARAVARATAPAATTATPLSSAKAT